MSIKHIKKKIITTGAAIISRGASLYNVTKTKKRTAELQKEIDENQKLRKNMEDVINEKQKLQEENIKLNKNRAVMEERIKRDDYTIKQIIGEYKDDNEKMRNERIKNEKKIDELERPQIINKEKIEKYELEIELLTKAINKSESNILQLKNSIESIKEYTLFNSDSIELLENEIKKV